MRGVRVQLKMPRWIYLIALAATLSAQEPVRILPTAGLAAPPAIPGLVDVRPDPQGGYLAQATVDARSLLHRIGFQVDVITAARDYEATSYADLAAEIAQLQADHATICRLYSIGDSLNGLPLWVLRITDHPDIEEDEPEVKLVGGIHGDERSGVEMAMRYAIQLLESYGSDPVQTALIDHTDIHILPLMNPDGWEALRRGNDNNVDLNRNFPSPFMPLNHLPEQEVQHIVNWTLGRHFALSGGLHSGAIGVIYPWGHFHDHTDTDAMFPETDLVRTISLEYTLTNPNMLARTGGQPWGGSWDRGVINGAAWFKINGEMADWNYRYAGCLETTIEFTQSKTPNAFGMDQAWTENETSLKTYMAGIQRGIHGTVRCATTEAPLNASILIWSQDATAQQITLETGWNVVALPAVPADRGFDVIFPNATCAWEYDPIRQSFRAAAELTPGRAAWVHNTVAETIEITGLALPGFSLGLGSGWNLAGVTTAAAMRSSGVRLPIVSLDRSGVQATMLDTAESPLVEPVAGDGQWLFANFATSVPIGPDQINPPLATRSDAENGLGDFHRVALPGRYLVTAVDQTQPTVVDVSEALRTSQSALSAEVDLPYAPTTRWEVIVPEGIQANGLAKRVQIPFRLTTAAQAETTWRINGGAWQRQALRHQSGDRWQVTVPGLQAADSVEYYHQIVRRGAVLARHPATGVHTQVVQ